MPAFHRPFSVTEHDDGWLVLVGCRHFRLNRAEADELARTITGRPTIQRYVIGEL